MYQRILVPVDGSDLTDRAITESIDLARQLGAAITGFVAAPMLEVPDRPTSASALLRDAEEHDAITAAHARQVLDRFGLLPLDFDGVHDSIYHAFDKAGNRHMEYVHQRGTFDDMPLQQIVDDFDRVYPFYRQQKLAQADFTADVERETR